MAVANTLAYYNTATIMVIKYMMMILRSIIDIHFYGTLSNPSPK
jgi:hypothetical protein